MQIHILPSALQLYVHGLWSTGLLAVVIYWTIG